MACSFIFVSKGAHPPSTLRVLTAKVLRDCLSVKQNASSVSMTAAARQASTNSTSSQCCSASGRSFGNGDVSAAPLGSELKQATGDRQTVKTYNRVCDFDGGFDYR